MVSVLIAGRVMPGKTRELWQGWDGRWVRRRSQEQGLQWGVLYLVTTRDADRAQDARPILASPEVAQ